MRSAVVLSILVLCGLSFAQESEEVEVTCSRCHGKKVMQVYVQCSNCGGKGMIEEQIHNGDMKYIRTKDGRKPTKTNRKRCPVCLKSAKKGMVKVEKDCDRCSGTGTITQIRKVVKKAKPK